jgi:predicted outer membrane repeat protein
MVARASCPCALLPRPVLRERAGVRVRLPHLSEPLESRLLLATIYVDANPAIATHDGLSWDTAYADLQPVLTAAVSGTTIKVADGTYKPTTGTDRTVSFVLKNGVGLYGGYAGFGATDPDARDVAAYPTILSGDIGLVGDNSDNSYHVVVGSNTDATALIDGFTITGGNVNGSNSPTCYGGGMYNASGSPTISNCSFSGNTAGRTSGSSYGGAIYNSSSSPTLTNCTFIGNTAAERAGAIYNFSSSPTLTNCTFIGNTAGSFGGAIYNDSSSPTLTNCILWGNAAPHGSQIAQSGGTTTATYCDIQAGGFPGIGSLDTDPLFVRFPWTGPDGSFGTADDDYGDLRLRAGSPCLDAGSNAAIPAGVTTDLAGQARIQNGTVDLGAYEGSFTVPAPKTIYVDGNAPGAGSGTSWTDAFTTLGAALLAATDGDTIRVADGTYKPTTTNDRTFTFALRNAVSILGGYAGYGVPDPNARDSGTYPTILSGDIGSVNYNSDNSYHVLTTNVVSASAVLDAVTVSGGNANGSGSNQSYGGGLFAQYVSPTLTNCTFTGNNASGFGGAIYNGYSSPTLTNCTFSGNSVTYCGGAIYNDRSSPTLTNCTFTGNTTWNTRGPSDGGAIYNSSSSPALINCTFSANTVYSFGGAIFSVSSYPTLTNCAFSGNKAGYGGAMLDFASWPTLTNCIFNGNSAYYGGAIHDRSFSSLTLTNCTFSGNGAYGSGANGGAIYNDNSISPPTLANCTFSGNSATISGGAIYSSTSSPTLANCILWGNAAASGSQIYQASGTTTATYCDVQGGFPGTGNINTDPLFVGNPTPGPDGKWGTADDDYGDLRLQITSPCIDAGSNAGVPAGVTTDLAGNARIIDIPGIHDPGAIVDMGAYEHPLPTTATIAGPGGAFSARLSAGKSTLQVWAGPAVGSPMAQYSASYFESFVFDTGAGNDTLTLDASNGLPPALFRFLAGAGNDTLILTGTSATDSLNIQPGQVALGPAIISTTDTETVLLDAPAGSALNLNSLTLASPATLPAGKGLVLKLNALSLTGSGSLDLADNQMILNYTGPTPAQTVRQWVANGQTGSTPSIRATALVSTKTLAMIDNALVHMPAFAGQTLASPFSQILIRPAFRGDANLDGQVDDQDFLPILTNLGRPNAQWLLGDLDQDGDVDLDDYAQVMANVGAGALLAGNGGINPTLQAKPAPQPNVKAQAKSQASKIKQKPRRAKLAAALKKARILR